MENELQASILIIDDDEDVLFAAELFLRQHNYNVKTENHPDNVPGILQKESFDVILLDMNYAQGITDGAEGFFWLNKILEADPDAVVILITAYGDVEMALKAIRLGATDYILKPWQNEKLLATISMGTKMYQSYREKHKLESQQKLLRSDIDQPFSDIIGQCDEMLRVFSIIKKVAKTDANVLILGANGTGKEIVARALHRSSSRAEEIFMSVDLGAIPESLFESELFGHVKGAFTGAIHNRTGRIEAASGGTLFLDEIGNLSMPLQAKLLQALEARKVTPVGANKSRDIDIRLLCATNMPLYAMVENNEFRQDLLYRVNTVEIKLPPLRERYEDIPVLLDHFIDVFCKKYKMPIKKLGKAVQEKLMNYQWPGNIRELKHLVERAVILSGSDILEYKDFLFPERGIVEPTEADIKDLNLENVEKTVIRKALVKHNGNISNTSKELGLTRTSLYRRLKKYGL